MLLHCADSPVYLCEVGLKQICVYVWWGTVVEGSSLVHSLALQVQTYFHVQTDLRSSPSLLLGFYCEGNLL